MRTRTTLPLLIALVATLLAAHACGGSDPEETPATVPTSTPSPSPTPTIDARAVLLQSGEAMEALVSFEFQLTHKSGGTTLIPGLVIKEAEGFVIKPDKISAEFSGAFGGFAIKAGLITLGEDSYMTNPLTGRWETVPREVSPLGFFDPSKGIAAMMSRVTEATVEPGEGDVYTVVGSLPAEAMAPLLGSTVKGSTISVELTIDATDLYLLEARVSGRVTAAEPDGTIRVIRLTRFNEEFTIEAPE